MADNDNNLVFTVSSDMTAAQRGLSKFVGDIDSASTQISKKFESVGRSIDKGVSTALQSKINAAVGIGTVASKEWTGALADQGKQLDALRAKYSPLFAVVKQYQSAQTDIRTLYRSGKLSVDEYTAALSKQRQAALANIAAIKGVPKAQNDNGGGNSYVFRNIAQQVNQIGQQGAATGNYLQALAIQLPDILGAFGSLPAVLAGGALAVGGSFLSMALETKKLDDVLADHEKVVNRVVSAYGGLAEKASKAGTDSKQLINALGTKNQNALSVAAAAAAKDFFGDSKVGSTPIGGRFRGFQATVTEFQQPLAKLRADLKDNKADFDAFYEAIDRKVQANPSLAKAGADVIALSENLKLAADAMKQYQRIRDAVFNDSGPNGRLLSQGTTNNADAGNLALYQSQQKIALQRSQQAINAEIAGINARSPAERVAAARAGATAQYSDDESPAQRRQRIDNAGLVAQAQIEKQISDAQRDRSLSLQKLIDDQQNEISLTGKSSQEADVLRKAYELTSQIRIQAAKDGTQVDEKEIETIRLKAIELGKLQQAYKALSTGVTTRGFVIGSPAEQDYFDYTDSQRLSLDRGKETLDAQIAGLNARSPAQRVAAARQSAAAQHPDESAAEREQRITNAGLLAQAQINKELAEAERDRSLNLKKLSEDQKQDIALIGKTGGEAAAATQQYQLMSQLRAEATKQGITDEAEFQKVFSGQIDKIKQAADGYGKLVDARAKAQLTYDLNDKARLAGMTPRQQQIVETQRQYGLPQDPNNDTGKQIGQSLQLEENREAVTTFLTDFKDGLVKNGESIGKAFGTALENSLMKQADKLWDQAFKLIGNALFPGSGTGATGGGAGAGGLVGVGGAAVGKAFSPGIINNAPVGAVTRAPLGAVDKAFTLLNANENKNGSQINSFLKQGGVDIDAAQTAWCAAFVNSSLSQVGVKGTGSLTANSFLNWGSKIDPSQVLRGDVLVQNRGLGAADAGGHVGFATGASRMFGGQQQLQMLSGNSADSVQTTWVNAINVQARRATDAADALSKVAGSAGTATQGLGKLGQVSTSFFPPAPSGAAAAPATGGGGGLFGWLGGLFGGSSGSQWNLAAAGKLKPGLFADGGYTGPGGRNTPAGIVHAGEFVIPKHIVDKIGVPALSGMIKGYANGGLVTPRLVSAPTAPALAPRYGTSAANNNGPGILHVQISGASGDDHVRTLVKQGVGEGLSTYNTQQRRGGFGTLQGRYANQKG